MAKGDTPPEANENYALGRDKFYRMIREGELISLAPEKVLESGLARIAMRAAGFRERCQTHRPLQAAIDVFKAIQKDHPTAKNLIPGHARQTSRPSASSWPIVRS